MAGTGLAAGTVQTTLLDATSLRGTPLTVDPFQPAPGCAVQAHADRLAALCEVAFQPSAPALTAFRLALRRVYADRGWDLVSGTARPGPAAPGIPSLRDVQRAALVAAADLGYARAAVSEFLDRLSALWLGPARYFLTGGHPADMAGLLRQNVIFAAGDVADSDGAVFLAGVLLIRLAGQRRADVPGAVVVAIPAGRLRRLLDELRSRGTEVIEARYVPAAGGSAAPPGHSQAAPLGRRSAACGPRCLDRPCSGRELHTAGLLAAADSQVWLRLWGQALVLAFVTGQPLPHAPPPVRRTWRVLDARTRECLLATVVQAAVMSRALALRHSYDPGRLAAAVASTAAGLLTRHGGSRPVRAGRIWVVPQLRWLHEVARLHSCGGRVVERDDIAPPLDFELTGLPDWPGIRVGDRLDALRRHRLSMYSEPNRVIAVTVLLGTGQDGTDFEADLAIAGIGLHPQHRLGFVARALGAGPHAHQPGWLEEVLSWPSRLIATAADPGVPEAATG